MRYIPDLYYFHNKEDFPSDKAILVTAKTIGNWCSHYKAKGFANDIKEGRLPKNQKEKENFIEDLVYSLIKNSISIFGLHLYSRPNFSKFSHHDVTSCWEITLSKDEFKVLQNAYLKSGLPSDIFYNPDDTIFRPYPFKSKLGKFLGTFWPFSSATKVYSPNQWKEVNAFYKPS